MPTLRFNDDIVGTRGKIALVEGTENGDVYLRTAPAGRDRYLSAVSAEEYPANGGLRLAMHGPIGSMRTGHDLLAIALATGVDPSVPIDRISEKAWDFWRNPPGRERVTRSAVGSVIGPILIVTRVGTLETITRCYSLNNDMVARISADMQTLHEIVTNNIIQGRHPSNGIAAIPGAEIATFLWDKLVLGPSAPPASGEEGRRGDPTDDPVKVEETRDVALRSVGFPISEVPFIPARLPPFAVDAARRQSDTRLPIRLRRWYALYSADATGRQLSTMTLARLGDPIDQPLDTEPPEREESPLGLEHLR